MLLTENVSIRIIVIGEMERIIFLYWWEEREISKSVIIVSEIKVVESMSMVIQELVVCERDGG